MYTIDFGHKASTIYNTDTDETQTISHKDVLNLPQELPAGSLVICEYAHLGCPRREKSLAQVFTEQELFRLYAEFRDNDIVLKLFPHQSTPRACSYSQVVKSDFTDPKAIARLLQDFPEIMDSLMNPPKSFDLSNNREESYDWVEESNFELNRARAGEDKDKYRDQDDHNHQFLVEHCKEIYDELSEEARSAFNFTLYKVANKNKGYQKGDVKINDLKLAAVFAVLVQLQDYDGNLRLREVTGELPGWKFVKRYAIKMTPFHFKGGVARSNLYHYGAKNWVSAKMAEELGVKKTYIKSKRRGGYYRQQDDEYVPPFTPEEDNAFRKYRQKYCKAIKELFTICKKIHSRGVHLIIPSSP